MLTRYVKSLLKRAGFTLHRIDAEYTPSRLTLEGTVKSAKRAGLSVKTVLDVGAAYGATASTLSGLFPDAAVLAMEPLEEFRTELLAVSARNSKVQHIPIAVGREDGTVTLNVHADLDGSSIYGEAEGPAIDGAPRSVELRTLDSLCAELKTAGPYLVKIDVQGAELDVIEGAASVLKDSAFVIIETSLFPFFKGGPLLSDLVSAMTSRGFRCYDIVGIQYRLLDGALSQADLVFVPNDSPLIADARYATPEQRSKHNLQMNAARRH